MSKILFFVSNESFSNETIDNQFRTEMDAEKIRTSITKADLAMTEARERLQTIMTTYMAEAIEQIGQTLEACQVKKNRLIDRLEEVYTAVEAVRNECSTIDANIA